MKPTYCIILLLALHSSSGYSGAFGPISKLTSRALRLLEEQSRSTMQNPLVRYRGRLGIVTGGFLTSLCLADTEKKPSTPRNTLQPES